MNHFKLLKLTTHLDERGHLTVLENVLPFDVVRAYWIYDTNNNIRGGHRHHCTQQALIAIAGCVTVYMDDGNNQETIILKSPSECLLVEPKDWHEMTFERESILLVFASRAYDSSDYIYERYNGDQNDRI